MNIIASNIEDSLSNKQFLVFTIIACALSTHLMDTMCIYRFSTKSGTGQTSKPTVAIHCHLCEYIEPYTEADYFPHCSPPHLKLKKKVLCLYEGCYFQSDVYSTFNIHKSAQWNCSTI